MKPGFKTTEFWLSLAATLLAFLMSSGLFVDGSTTMKLLGMAAGVLATLGYTASRAIVKRAETAGAAAVETAKLGKPQ